MTVIMFYISLESKFSNTRIVVPLVKDAATNDKNYVIRNRIWKAIQAYKRTNWPKYFMFFSVKFLY